jgi:hypothetical protein
MVMAHRVAGCLGCHILSRQSAHRWWQGCQPYTLAALYPQEDSWNSFLLEAESTPRTIVWLEGLGKLKKINLIGTLSRNLLACSIVPQPTMLPRAPSSHE